MTLPADQTGIRVHTCATCDNLYAWVPGDKPWLCPRCQRPLTAQSLNVTITALSDYKIFCTHCGRLSKHEHPTYPECVLCQNVPRGFTANLNTS